MGTRSLTFVYDESNTPIINMYAQYDGYPSGVGADIARFLTGMTVVNGLGRDTTGVANGMGCLAAQLIANFKQSAGGFYIYSVDDTDCGQDYEYHIYANKVAVKDYSGKQLFSGSWAEFEDFCYETA